MYTKSVADEKKVTKNPMRSVAALLVAGSMSLFAADAFAAVTGGFRGPGPDLVTVKQALEMRDDTRVSLKGNIVKSLGDEAYTFKDATGTIEVEIDDDIWRGQMVKPEDVVVISGEMDKDWSHISIDVSSVTKE